MTDLQKTTIRCAYLDLLGAYQSHGKHYASDHDWDAHLSTIEEMERAFPDLLQDLMEETD